MDGCAIELSGPDARVSVEAVQPLVLAAHELATNAAKYGAFSVSEGSLSVKWNRTASGEIVVQWIETGMQDMEEPNSSGFGSRVIDQVLVMQLNARVEKKFSPEGLELKITLPSSVLEPAE